MSLMTPAQTSKYLGLAENTLAKWRQQGKGPRWIQINGRCVRYDPIDVDLWVNSRKRQSTESQRVQ